MTPDQPKPTILIVDDEAIILRSLASILSESYNISVAKGASQAEALLNKGLKPDLILLDIVMPELSGLDYCAQLKADDRYKTIPVIFITSLTDPDDEMRAFQAGAVDFITKPISPASVKLRVSLHLQLEASRGLLEQQNQVLEKERQDISRILEKMRDTYKPTSDQLKYKITPTERNSGDILLAAENPSGSYFFLGDFTGHGLPAAVGSPSLARVFVDNVKKQQLTAEELLVVLNMELNLLLPTGMFVCGCLVFSCKTTGQVHIWNAGLPPQYLCRDGDIQAVNSTAPPLGVVARLNNTNCSLTVAAEAYSSLFLYTDGLTESADQNNDMFGEERLQELLKECPEDVNRIHDTVIRYCLPGTPGDDLTMASIRLRIDE